MPGHTEDAPARLCPAVNLDEGLKRTVAWYSEHQAT